MAKVKLDKEIDSARDCPFGQYSYGADKTYCMFEPMRIQEYIGTI